MMIRWYTKRALHFSKRTAMALLWFPSAPQVVRTRNSHGSFTTVMVGLSVQMVGNRDTTKNMSVILITSPRAQHQPSTSVGPWIISSLQYFQSLNSITQGPIINHHPLCSAINHSQPFSTILNHSPSHIIHPPMNHSHSETRHPIAHQKYHPVARGR